ncbi:DEAD/DEAH box helicase [Natronoglycomyces albus]|uniref:DEAD/DEAH box helicase n=1 Tax=Natronoglycomyces albus TaxID=2811108 RepID=A0A895XLR9_9ACTN|nr:DEAD/DEAH box helicase [Natronoglycomyces albus]QSB04732.1 DEAD/DEAH box helicase [Natronoglycomyces albus]
MNNETSHNTNPTTPTTSESASEPATSAPETTVGPTFAELGVREESVQALAELGIHHAFAIQEFAIPIGMRGSDVIGRAPTGTGKTFGFGLPMIDRILSAEEGADGRPQGLVLVPTRELGLQVARDLENAGKTRNIRVLPIYGGRAYEPQIKALKTGVDIVVGTPGRLLDLYKSKHLQFDGVHKVVLDEADRMLDLGFADDVEKILGMLPEDRQTMLFSATMPDTIMGLSRRHMYRPVTVSADVDPAETDAKPNTEQFVYLTHALNKAEVLVRLLQAEGRGLSIVFCRTKRAAQKLSDELEFRGFAVGSVHGDLGQSARERSLRAFRSGKIDVLVATDVAARGLDVTDVTHVINYDTPEETESYVHRIGRTGRAGAKGVAVTFVTWEDLPRWKIIAKTLKLDLGDPVETYHTSDHLYSDLNIPTDAANKVLRSENGRTGLESEAEIKDDEESPRRGRNRRRPAQGRSRTRDKGRRAESGSEATSDNRSRQRTRSGRPKRGQAAAEGGSAPKSAASGTGSSESQGSRRRRRRRRPSGSSESD